MTPGATVIEERHSATNLRSESIFAEVLAGVLGVDRVQVDRHFFEELGADSLVMAHFCARVRKRGDLPSISIQDVYRHPTIRSLAAALADAGPRAVQSPVPAPTEAAAPASRLEYVACGVLQLLSLLGYCYLAVLGAGLACQWISAGSDTGELYLRLVLCGGAGTVIRRESFFQCYRAQAGRIEIGRVTLGRSVVIGERTVLDINASMGDGAQLGHASALHSGQSLPAGQRWHGSPAQHTEMDYLRVAPMACGTLRRVSFSAGTLLLVFLVYLPFVAGIPYLLAPVAPSLARLLEPSATASTGVLTFRKLLIGALELSSLLFFGAVLIGLPLVVVVPRVLNLFLDPDRVYPLYGFHDRVQRAITRLGAVRLFVRLFGDSSYIVHYLSWLGYHLSPVEQTGSNFGIVVTQANPHLCCVGTGTMVADGLTIINDEVSSTSFCVARASIGPRNFLGNDVTYPPGSRTGDNCLLATKVMVPLDGTIRNNTGLLGSPCFEIPRTVDRDTRFDHLRTGDEFRRRLAAKNRYNLRTMGIFLVARWLGVFIVTALDLSAFALYDVAGHVATAGLLAASLLVSPLYFALVERCLAGFRSLEPTYCSIYDPRFWLHERLWKVPALDYLHAFDGSAYKTFIWRLMGVRMGRRVFDDGVHVPERTLATIGDDCVLNNGSKIQCHSQEDATFKSDRTTMGAGCTIGVGALVHYGVTMGEGSELAADSFLMKGAEVPADERWGGNPARELGW